MRNNHVPIDPTANVERPQIKTEGHPPWIEEWAETYQRHWPRGTRERVWLDVLLSTGLRVGDAVRFGPWHVRAGEMKTEKTGQIVYPELDPECAETLAAGPVGDLTYIVSANGRAFTTKKAFSNAFIQAARAAGVVGSAHGVRKLAATRAANRGLSETTLDAMFGWTGGRMASLYTRSADRKRLARDGMALLKNKKATSIPSPNGKVRAAEQKIK